LKIASGSSLLQLERQGQTVSEEATMADPNLLMYVMETREEIDKTAPREAARLAPLLAEAERREADCVASLGAALSAGDLGLAAALLGQLRYLENIKGAILDKL
jgi:hypothetical protein